MNIKLGAASLLSLAGSAAVVLIPHAAHAEESRVEFNIQAQDLSEALREYGIQSGKEVLFVANEVHGIKVSGIKGSLDPAQALTALMQNTGVSYRKTPQGTVLVGVAYNDQEVTPSVPAAPASPPSNTTEAATESVEGKPQTNDRTRLSPPSPAPTNAYIDTVIVTARKTEESLIDVPLAISAFSGAQLADQGIQDITEIQYQVPSLVFSQTATSSFSPLVSMRGQTQGTIAISVDPSVGVYVDNIYLSGTAGLNSYSSLDVDRVEVLKGPQGTLFGRNTTGGALSIITKAPSDIFELETSASIGNYGYQKLDAVVNIPIVQDVLAVRFAGRVSERDGFGYDANRNVNVGDQDLTTGRASLRFTPNDRFEALLRADFVSGQDNGLLTHPIYIDPSVAIPSLSEGSINLTGSNTVEGRAIAAGRYQDLINQDPFSVRYNGDIFSTIDTENYSATLTYDFGGAELKSITALRKTEDVRNYEVDDTDFINLHAFTSVDLEQFTQELQLSGEVADNRLKYVIGGFYYGLEGTERGETDQFSALTNNQVQITQARLDTTGYAAFSQATYAVTDRFNVTGGVRYTWEEKVINALGGTLNDTRPFTCSLPAALNPDLTTCNVRVPNEEENFSYTAVADYKLTDTMMAYARTARSYKSGGVNQRIIGNSELTANLLLPEEVTDYEIGLKGDVADGRIRAQFAYYRSNYNDIQRSAVSCSGTQCSSVLFNAAEATIDGFEAELTVVPIDNLRLSATTAYTMPEYNKYESGGIDNTRENFLEVPEWTYSFSGGYTYPTSFGEVRAQLDWAWQDEMDMAPQDYPGGIRLVGGVPSANGPGTPDNLRIQPSYGLLNAMVAISLDDQNVDIRFWGKNMLDERYWSHALGNVNGGLGLAIATPGAPSTYGMDVAWHF